MFDLRKSYNFSKDKANQGVPMIVGPNPKEDYVLLRRLPNDLYRTKLSEVMLKEKKTLEILKAQDPEAHAKKDAEIYATILAETVFAGWGKGIVDGGAPVPFSTEAAKEMILKYPDFKDDCIDFASDRKNYPAEIEIEEVKKN
jgi:hypothetical protein